MDWPTSNSIQPVQPAKAVQLTNELMRVVGLPSREWTEEDAGELAERLTLMLRRIGGTMTLRPIQAQALFEAGTVGGLFGPIRVGGGKTLITLLLCYVMDLKRPLLLLPAALVDKTKRAIRLLQQHWLIPNFIRIQSYELLGRTQSANVLNQYQPDGIIADEAHRLKNIKRAACAKRVDRYMEAHPQTKFAALSGTITKRSIEDFAHILQWCLGLAASPVPSSKHELIEWADALDEKTSQGPRFKVGALTYLTKPEDWETGYLRDDVKACRKGFSRRLRSTPGVVATSEGFLGCSLQISALEVDVSQSMVDCFEKLRNEWATPDDWPISDPLSLWRHARELSLGFYYQWDPRPPDEWLDARKEWAKICRHILGHNKRHLDSEKQVVIAVDKGRYPEASEPLENWRQIKNSFEPNTVPVWFDYSVIEAAQTWALKGPGIIWTSHTAFAELLAKQSGLPYYGRKGLDKLTGRSIPEYGEPGCGEGVIIASTHSNRTGRNLQQWDRNLVIDWPSNGEICEQLLGRTHRDLQIADEVTFDVVLTSLEHAVSFYQCQADATYEETLTNQAQKLLYADVTFPDFDEIWGRGGYRWRK